MIIIKKEAHLPEKQHPVLDGVFFVPGGVLFLWGISAQPLAMLVSPNTTVNFVFAVPQGRVHALGQPVIEQPGGALLHSRKRFEYCRASSRETPRRAASSILTNYGEAGI